MGIPQREISLRQFAETEFAPCEVLQEHIAAWMSEHARAAGEQKIAKHSQRHCQQEDQRKDRGTPAVHRAETLAAAAGKSKPRSINDFWVVRLRAREKAGGPG